MTPLGVEIRRLRSAKQMTLKTHAALVGVTPAYLSALEHGHRGLPTAIMLEKICAALELSEFDAHRLQKLLEYSRPKVTLDTSGLKPIATEVANRLAVGISNMSERDLNALLTFLRRTNSEHVDQPPEFAALHAGGNSICE